MSQFSASQKYCKFDNPILEGPDCQDPYGGQGPFDESMKLFATAGDGEPIDGDNTSFLWLFECPLLGFMR